MMKAKYGVFAGHCYYPTGGWDDFLVATETLEAADVSARTWCEDRGGGGVWWQIVDFESLAIVASHNTWGPRDPEGD